MKAGSLSQGTLSTPQGAVLWILAILGFLLGLMLFPLLTFEGLPPLAVALVAALPVVFWVYLAAGLFAWWRRPRNGVGMLLIWTGMGVWIVGANNTAVPALQVTAPIFTSLTAAALVHLLLAFPTGRLASTQERLLVARMYIAMILLQALRIFFDPPALSPGWNLSGVFSVLQLAAVTALSTAVAVVLMARVVVPPKEMQKIAALRGENDLRAGMPAEVMVPLRERTALGYLVEPLTQRLWRAGREH